MILRPPHTLSTLSILSFNAKPKTPFPIYTTLFSRLYATSTPTPTPTSPSSSHHPWPEWVAFIDRLNSQGYFPPKYSSSSIRYAEFDLLKDPCLSFARDRFDLFSSLSKGDIQTLVEGGCPKIQRKVVNSAKRLRVYVGLEEKSVCNICSLQGTCDRAFVMLGESEGVARMVDVMRLLLTYALDPVLISGTVSGPSIEQAESASRRLLSFFVNVSETLTDDTPHESTEKSAYRKERSVTPRDASMSQDVEKKKGDWTCPKCNFMNYSRNFRCRKCNEEGPKRVDAVVEMKKGDWKCLQCECINFASRRNCFRCKDPRPPRVLEPGEWECSKCDFLNFRRNITCLKCRSDRPKEAASQDMAHKQTNFVDD